MEFISEINVIYVVALCNALILFAVAAILRGEPRREPLPLEAAVAVDQALTEAVVERLEEISRRLEKLEQLERRSAEAVPAPVPAGAAAGSGQRYGEALRLVGGGAVPDDLVSRCGLSRGEADLFVRLHGNRHRGEAAAVRQVS